MRVYPGADGVLSFYEDDGSSFRYQKGEFVRIACSWNDKQRTLSCKADPQGQRPKQKVVSIEIVGTPGSKRMTLSGDTVQIQL
jgi:alpha-D-xyloside xylohydrolase